MSTSSTSRRSPQRRLPRFSGNRLHLSEPRRLPASRTIACQGRVSISTLRSSRTDHGDTSRMYFAGKARSWRSAWRPPAVRPCGKRRYVPAWAHRPCDPVAYRAPVSLWCANTAATASAGSIRGSQVPHYGEAGTGMELPPAWCSPSADDQRRQSPPACSRMAGPWSPRITRLGAMGARRWSRDRPRGSDAERRRECRGDCRPRPSRKHQTLRPA